MATVRNIHQYQQSVKSIVFGGRGMLGSDLTSALNAAGYMTRAFDLPNATSPTG